MDVEFGEDRVVLVGLLRVNGGPLKRLGREKMLGQSAGFLADKRPSALLAQGFGHMEHVLGGGVVAIAHVDQESVEGRGRHAALMEGVLLDGIKPGDTEILFEGEGLSVALLGGFHVRLGGVVLCLAAVLLSQRIVDRKRELPAFRIRHILGVFDGIAGGGPQGGTVFVGHHEFVRIGLNVGAASQFFGADIQAARRRDAGRPEGDAEFRLHGADDAGLLVIAEPERVLRRPFIHGVPGLFGKGFVDGPFRFRRSFWPWAVCSPVVLMRAPTVVPKWVVDSLHASRDCSTCVWAWVRSWEVCAVSSFASETPTGACDWR